MHSLEFRENQLSAQGNSRQTTGNHRRDTKDGSWNWNCCTSFYPTNNSRGSQIKAILLVLSVLGLIGALIAILVTKFHHKSSQIQSTSTSISSLASPSSWLSNGRISIATSSSFSSSSSEAPTSINNIPSTPSPAASALPSTSTIPSPSPRELSTSIVTILRTPTPASSTTSFAATTAPPITNAGLPPYAGCTANEQCQSPNICYASAYCCGTTIPGCPGSPCTAFGDCLNPYGCVTEVGTCCGYGPTTVLVASTCYTA